MFKRLGTIFKRIFKDLIDPEHILTPFAVEHLHRGAGLSTLTYRIYYVFGIRVAYYSTIKKA